MQKLTPGGAARLTNKKQVLKLRDRYDIDNSEAARAILADIEKYGGEAAGLVQWARLAVARIDGERGPQ